MFMKFVFGCGQANNRFRNRNIEAHLESLYAAKISPCELKSYINVNICRNSNVFGFYWNVQHTFIYIVDI